MYVHMYVHINTYNTLAEAKAYIYNAYIWGMSNGTLAQKIPLDIVLKAKIYQIAYIYMYIF